MTPHSDSSISSSGLIDRRARADRAVAASASLAVVLFTAIVVARGAGGHFERGLRWPGVLCVYLGLTLIAAWAHWLRMRLLQQSTVDAVRGVTDLPVVAIVCPLLSAMMLGPRLSAGALICLWSMTGLLAAGSIWLISRRSGALTRLPTERLSPQTNAHVATPQTAQTLVDTVATTAPVKASKDPDPVVEDETFSQRWTRREGELGDELEGTLKIFFAPGQQTASADIPIVPAMRSIPDVDCELLNPGAGDVQVIIRAAHTYGVRLELQRPAERTTAEEVELAVLIHVEQE
jgi:hypothetical protein